MQRKRVSKKGKIEFSKILVIAVVIGFAAYGLYNGFMYNHLVQLAIEKGVECNVTPDPSLAVICVTGILGSILTYCLYQGLLKTSLNKNKLKIDNEGCVQSLIDGDVKELIKDVARKQLGNDEESAG